MDLDYLKAIIDDLVEERTPILGVVAVIGTTEEGAVDELTPRNISLIFNPIKIKEPILFSPKLTFL